MDLASYLKYCLGYVRMSRTPGSLRGGLNTLELLLGQFELIRLLDLDLDGSTSEDIKLPLFESLDPKNVPPEQDQEYNRERNTAKKLEQLRADARNATYTKQLNLRFGFFKISLPLNPVQENEDETGEGGAVTTLRQAQLPLMKEMEFPLFSLQVDLDRRSNKFSVTITDPAIEVHVSELVGVLSEPAYQQLTQTMGEIEAQGGFCLPLQDLSRLNEFWTHVRSALSLSHAQFDSNSFQIERVQLALGGRSNFFLSDDLRKLTLLSPEELEGTALAAWTSDEEMGLAHGEFEESELFFPFAYDKYQARILSLLGNRASVIQGPPGTGKSQSICNLICHLAAKGHKILFVSQKPQALKVVKDRLKTLDVQSFFGYIPSSAPGILSEEDEADGAGPALAKVGASAQVLGGKLPAEPNPNSGLEEKNKARNALQQDLDREKEFVKLWKELEELKDREVEISEPERFSREATPGKVQGLLLTRDQSVQLDKKAGELAQGNDFSLFEPAFPDVQWGGDAISSAVEEIRTDWIAHGPKGDKPSRLSLWWANRRHRRRTAAAWVKIPAEISAYFESLLARQESRVLVTSYLASFRGYALAKEARVAADELSGSAEALRILLGLTNENIHGLEEKQRQGCSLESLVEANLRLIQVNAAIQENLSRKVDRNALEETVRKSGQKRGVTLASCLNNRMQKRVAEAITNSRQARSVLAQFAKAFNKAKKAFRTFDRLRRDADQYQVVLNALPVWMMELEAASRLLPLQAGLFDYVIFDEASQCNVAYAMPAMFRAKRALFFGDSLQMRDPTAQVARNQSFEDLAATYRVPDPLRIKASEGEIQSVLDIAAQRGIPSVALQYHYRSPAELIGFSNENFYKQIGFPLFALQHSYTPFHDSGRIMLVHQVDPATSDGSEMSPRENQAEARFILELVQKIKSDPSLKDLSIGILSFFNDQARCIRRTLEGAKLEVDGQNLKVAIIEGIQGDEKDIIIYSMVIRDPKEKRMYQMLTGETGELRKDISAGRVNVAFSRARKQVHAVVSMPTESIPDGIWIKRFLTYAQENGKPSAIEEALKPFDSRFEEEFYAAAKSLLGEGFVIRNQVPSCGFKIDFSITCQTTGRTLAVECDGPMHFVDEGETIQVQSDMERQEVLEKAGWRFHRIRYSDWLKQRDNPELVIAPVKQALYRKG
jgi:very-short-patch-repair endonuclease